MEDKKPNLEPEVSTQLEELSEKVAVKEEVNPQLDRIQSSISAIPTEDLTAKLEALQSKIQELTDENNKQNSKITKVVTRNHKQIGKSTAVILLVAGGLASMLVLLSTMDLNTEEGRKAYDDFESKVFDLISLVLVGGAGFGAFAFERSARKDDGISDDTTEDTTKE